MGRGFIIIVGALCSFGLGMNIGFLSVNPAGGMVWEYFS